MDEGSFSKKQDNTDTCESEAHVDVRHTCT